MAIVKMFLTRDKLAILVSHYRQQSCFQLPLDEKIAK